MSNDDFFKNIKTYPNKSNNHTKREIIHNALLLIYKLDKLLFRNCIYDTIMYHKKVSKTLPEQTYFKIRRLRLKDILRAFI